MAKRCRCSYGYCCDYCWRKSAKSEPCPSKGCENPEGHTGPCGVYNNTGTITISAADILGALDSGSVGSDD